MRLKFVWRRLAKFLRISSEGMKSLSDLLSKSKNSVLKAALPARSLPAAGQDGRVDSNEEESDEDVCDDPEALVASIGDSMGQTQALLKRLQKNT